MTDAPPVVPARSTRRDLLGRLCLAATLNVVVALVVSWGFITLLPPETALGWTAMLLAWLSTAVSLVGVTLLLFTVPVLVLPRRWTVMLLTVIGFGLFQIALYGDLVGFRLYRMHYNRMVWDMFTNPAVGDSLTLGGGTVLSITLVITGVLAAEAAIAWAAMQSWATRFATRRWLLGLLIGALALIVADKGVYAGGSLAGRSDITRVERNFPLYQRVTMRRFAMRRGWLSADDDGPSVRLGQSGLRYPRAEVAAPAQPERLNVVILAIEGCRFDMLDPAVMPRVHAFAQAHTWGRHHYSGGNATRFGIFSLVYGIHATYWQQALAERQGPLLIHVLKQLGYRFMVQACTDLNFPEFRQTAFVEVPEAITDKWPEGQRVERDRRMTDNLVRFIGESGDQPFFAFGFYDASHANYIYPPEHERFTPVQKAEGIDFLTIAGQSTVENLAPLANRYRNSLHYVDAQIGRVLDELERTGKLDNTLLFIAGDHGEEFGDLGYYGHNGAFNRYQIQTLFVANIPGLAPGPIDRVTSHIDVAPTILSRIGVTAPVGDYSNGLRLDQDAARDHIVSVSWESLALIDTESVMVRGLGSRSLTNDLLDRDYRPLTDPAVKARWMGRLPAVLESLRAFSR